MQEFKIYSTNKMILDKVCHNFDIDMDYLGEDIGKGYVSDGNTLRVFVKSSEVDQDHTILDITLQYVQTSTLFGGLGVL